MKSAQYLFFQVLLLLDVLQPNILYFLGDLELRYTKSAIFVLSVLKIHILLCYGDKKEYVKLEKISSFYTVYFLYDQTMWLIFKEIFIQLAHYLKFIK